MHQRSTQFRPASIAGLLIIALAACNGNDVTNVVLPGNSFAEARLVTDAGTATTVDPNVVNPWGIAFGPTGILWVSNNGTGTSTLYNADGTKLSTTVTIPAAGGGTAAPTGIVVNSTSDFSLAGLGPAIFLAASLGLVSYRNEC